MADEAKQEKTAVAGAEQHEFENLKEEGARSGARDIEFLLDIPLEITVQLGTTRMMIRELLQLGQVSVIELEKLAGEPMEIFANKRLVARGEVVVVNEKFGVRLTDVVSPSERVSKLK
jgi:flagellar motor switch protein FliN/FliY